MRLSYVIKYRRPIWTSAIAFYRDTLGLGTQVPVAFLDDSTTGGTTLALHPASTENPAGSVQLGLGSDDLGRLLRTTRGSRHRIHPPPTDMHGTQIARFRDCEGAEVSISGG